MWSREVVVNRVNTDDIESYFFIDYIRDLRNIPAGVNCIAEHERVGVGNHAVLLFVVMRLCLSILHLDRV